MPYVLVRESFLNGSCWVEGLPLNEGKILGKINLFINGINLNYNLEIKSEKSNIMRHDGYDLSQVIIMTHSNENTDSKMSKHYLNLLSLLECIISKCSKCQLCHFLNSPT